MVQDIRHHKAETNGPRLLNKKQFSISVRSVFVRKKHYPGKQFNVLQLYSEEYSMAEFVWDSVVLYVYLQCTFSFMGNRKFMLQRSFLHHPLRVRERTHSSLQCFLFNEPNTADRYEYCTDTQDTGRGDCTDQRAEQPQCAQIYEEMYSFY